MRKLLDKSLWIFLLIGAGNTLVSAAIMYLLYTRLHLGYWFSSAAAFALTSVASFFLNKRLSFQNSDGIAKTAWRFALVIAVCYLFAYSLAQPATRYLLSRLLPGQSANAEKIALFTGQILFTGLNYLGQRFFAFKK